MVTIILNALMSYHLVVIMLVEATVALAVLAYFGRPTRSERFLKTTQSLDLSPYNKEGPMKTTFTLALVLCGCLAGSARAADNNEALRSDYDARAALALASASTVANPQATPCDITGCKCGCADGGVCTCSPQKYKAGDRKNGYTLDEDGYWYKDEPAIPVIPMPQYAPITFPQEALRQGYQPMNFQPMMRMGFGGGCMRGCAGGG